MFSEKESDYENWRVLVDNWLNLEIGERRYPGLEMRQAMQGRALEFRNCNLSGEGGTYGERKCSNIKLSREVLKERQYSE